MQEHDLWIAVIEQAVNDLKLFRIEAEKKSFKPRFLYRSNPYRLYKWFHGKAINPSSFAWICEQLNADSSMIISRIKDDMQFLENFIAEEKNKIAKVAACKYKRQALVDKAINECKSKLIDYTDIEKYLLDFIDRASEIVASNK